MNGRADLAESMQFSCLRYGKKDASTGAEQRVLYCTVAVGCCRTRATVEVTDCRSSFELFF